MEGDLIIIMRFGRRQLQMTFFWSVDRRKHSKFIVLKIKKGGFIFKFFSLCSLTNLPLHTLESEHVQLHLLVRTTGLRLTSRKYAVHNYEYFPVREVIQ